MKKSLVIAQLIALCGVIVHIAHKGADALDWITLAVLGVSAFLNGMEVMKDAE